MTVQKALVCIPDISGYTEFMSGTDMQLSTKVISALLNEIVYANTIGLKVSEIEGDAVLFYKVGDPPPIEVLIAQCQLFHRQFYERITELRNTHKSSPDSENIPEMLGLKIVLHFGKIGFNKIGKQIKLIGEDVIISHRLLKNSIQLAEYVLISEQLMKLCDHSQSVYKFQQGSDKYEHLGLLKYSYLPL